MRPTIFSILSILVLSLIMWMYYQNDPLASLQHHSDIIEDLHMVDSKTIHVSLGFIIIYGL